MVTDNAIKLTQIINSFQILNFYMQFLYTSLLKLTEEEKEPRPWHGRRDDKNTKATHV